MNKKKYIKTFIYITISFILLGIISYVIRFQILTSHPGLSHLIIISSIYILVIVLFSLVYRRYSPLFQSTQKSSKLNKILYELIQKSVYLTEREDLYQAILESALSAIPSAQKGCILLLDSSTNILSFSVAIGYDIEVLKKTHLRLDQSYLYLESNGKIEHTVIINDPFGYDRKKLHDKNIDTILTAGTDSVATTLSTPIIYNGTLYGMINIDSKFSDVYGSDDIEVIELFALEVVNVLKLYSSMEKVNYFMNHDILTNTYNRKHFNETLTKKLSDTQDNMEIFTLISLDINDLKKANDEYGHECGDRLLVEFANRFMLLIPKESCFARFGGDEFQLLLPAHTVEMSFELMNKIRQYINNHPLDFHGNLIPITFCYGMVSFPLDKTRFEDLIKLADERMYEQKRNYHEIKAM